MPEYYFDIETNTSGLKPNYENDEILTIQFQRLKRLKTILEIERQFVAQLKALIIPLPAKANLPSLTLVKPIKTQTAS